MLSVIEQLPRRKVMFDAEWLELWELSMKVFTNYTSIYHRLLIIKTDTKIVWTRVEIWIELNAWLF